MPILTEAQVTKDEVAKMIADDRVKFLSSAVPGYSDPATKKPVSYATAIRRGLTAYDYVAVGGPLDKRVSALEGLDRIDAAEDAVAIARVRCIEDALDEPILDRPAT